MAAIKGSWASSATVASSRVSVGANGMAVYGLAAALNIGDGGDALITGGNPIYVGGTGFNAGCSLNHFT